MPPIEFCAASSTLDLATTDTRLSRRMTQPFGYLRSPASFIVIIIGGLGSVTGCFIGAILVALVANYAGFLVPKLALVSDIMLMVAVLLWRPRGLFPVTSR